MTDLAWDPFDPHRLAVGKRLGWVLGLREGPGAPDGLKGSLGALGQQ